MKCLITTALCFLSFERSDFNQDEIFNTMYRYQAIHLYLNHANDLNSLRKKRTRSPYLENYFFPNQSLIILQNSYNYVLNYFPLKDIFSGNLAMNCPIVCSYVYLLPKIVPSLKP